MDAYFLDTDDERWTDILTRVHHDVDHLPEYLAAYDAFRGNTSRLAVVEDADGILIVPLRLQRSDGGSLDAASAEAHSAPLFTAGTSTQWRRAAIRTLLQFLRRRDVVTLFLRFHPLLDSSPSDFARFGAVVEHGETFNIPLAQPLEEIRAAMSKTHRRGIRKFRAADYDYGPDAGWRNLPEFSEIYRDTMDRVGATDDFRFTLDFFERLRDNLGDRVTLWSLEVDGRLAFGSIVTECGGTVRGLYGAAHPDFHGKIPQIGTYDAEIEWALERGARNYYFDGAETASLRQFKERMATHRPRAITARIVIDPVEYGRACERWERLAGRSVGYADTYLPPYRKWPEPALRHTGGVPVRPGVSPQGESELYFEAARDRSATIGAWTGS